MHSSSMADSKFQMFSNLSNDVQAAVCNAILRPCQPIRCPSPSWYILYNLLLPIRPASTACCCLHLISVHNQNAPARRLKYHSRDSSIGRWRFKEAANMVGDGGTPSFPRPNHTMTARTACACLKRACESHSTGSTCQRKAHLGI